MDNEKEKDNYNEQSNDLKRSHKDYKKPTDEDYIHMKILNELTKTSPNSTGIVQKENVLETKSANIEKYREKFENQHLTYKKIITDYQKWMDKIEELVSYIKKGYESDGKLLSQNELDIKLNEMVQPGEISYNKLFDMNNFTNLTEDQIRSYINANHNIIEDGIKEKDGLINKYFLLVKSYVFPLIDNLNFSLSHSRNDGQKTQEQLEKIKKYKEQNQEDSIAYEKSLLDYKKWILKNQELIVYLEKNCIDISRIIEKFNVDIEHKIDILEEKDKQLLENRIKGINMINKMCKNMLNTGLNKIKNIQEKRYDKLHLIDNFESLTQKEIIDIFNSNYNIITNIRNEKDSIVRAYFKFINSQLLPIIDGVDSGIQYLNANNVTTLKYIISDIYSDMDKVLKELLQNIRVREIKTSRNQNIDFNLHQAIDIDYTRIEEMDETVAEVIRKGYEYLEDIYNTGINYIVRQVQVIAYKFKADENTSV